MNNAHASKFCVTLVSFVNKKFTSVFQQYADKFSIIYAKLTGVLLKNAGKFFI